jgi:hypothetical protein
MKLFLVRERIESSTVCNTCVVFYRGLVEIVEFVLTNSWIIFLPFLID